MCEREREREREGEGVCVCVFEGEGGDCIRDVWIDSSVSLGQPVGKQMRKMSKRARY